MARFTRIAFGAGIVLAAGWLIYTTVWFSDGLVGRAIDAATGEPIRDAVVVGSWQRVRAINAAPIDHFDVQETHTDLQGVFRLLPWGPKIRLVGSMAPEQPVVRIFHRNYEPLVMNGQSIRGFKAQDEYVEFTMTPSTPSASDVELVRSYAWHIALSFFDANSACPWSSVRNMWRALKGREAELVAAGAPAFLPPPFSTPLRGDCQ